MLRGYEIGTRRAYDFIIYHCQGKGQGPWCESGVPARLTGYEMEAVLLAVNSTGRCLSNLTCQ